MSNYKKWTEGELNILKAEYPYIENKILAVKLNKTVYSLIAQASKYNLKKLVFPSPSNKLTKEMELQVIDTYNSRNNTSLGEVSNLLNISRDTVRRILKRNNQKQNKLSDIQKSYSINETYFETIDTAIKAYILGFIHGDGYNLENPGRLCITLHNKDIETLELIKAELGFTGPIKTHVSRPHCSLTITNKKISKDLKNHGIYQKKSLTVEFPTNSIEKQYLYSFLLGLFDSDGCVYFKQTDTKITHQTLVFTGSKVMLEKIKELLLVDGIQSFIQKTKTKNHIQLRITNKEGIKKLTSEFLKFKFSLSRKRNKLLLMHNDYMTKDIE